MSYRVFSAFVHFAQGGSGEALFDPDGAGLARGHGDREVALAFLSRAGGEVPRSCEEIL